MPRAVRLDRARGRRRWRASHSRTASALRCVPSWSVGGAATALIARLPAPRLARYGRRQLGVLGQRPRQSTTRRAGWRSARADSGRCESGPSARASRAARHSSQCLRHRPSVFAVHVAGRDRAPASVAQSRADRARGCFTADEGGRKPATSGASEQQPAAVCRRQQFHGPRVDGAHQARQGRARRRIRSPHRRERARTRRCPSPSTRRSRSPSRRCRRSRSAAASSAAAPTRSSGRAHG